MEDTPWLVKAGIVIDFFLIWIGIMFASVRINSNNSDTPFTQTVILSMLAAALILTGLILWTAEIASEYILFVFATFALTGIMHTYTTILARMRYYA